jgi:ribosome-binding protein aMBF1 (putative translation factor)
MPKSDIPRNLVGLAVQKLRSERGWSQSMLAAKCQLAGWDISRSIVAAIEGRVRWVGDWEALRLAKVLHVSVADLYPAKVDWAKFDALSRARNEENA